MPLAFEHIAHRHKTASSPNLQALFDRFLNRIEDDATYEFALREAEALNRSAPALTADVTFEEEGGTFWLFRIGGGRVVPHSIRPAINPETGFDIEIETTVDADIVVDELTRSFGPDCVEATGRGVILVTPQQDIAEACNIAGILAQLTREPASARIRVELYDLFAHLEPGRGARFESVGRTADASGVLEDFESIIACDPLQLPDGLYAPPLPETLRTSAGERSSSGNDSNSPLTSGSVADRQSAARALIKEGSPGWSSALMDAVVAAPNQARQFERLRSDWYSTLAKLDRDDVRELLWRRLREEQGDAAAGVIAYYFWRHDTLLARLPAAYQESDDATYKARLEKAAAEAGLPRLGATLSS